MTYQVTTNAGVLLDAHLDIQSGDIRFYSRSGTTETPTARNVDYSIGLRTILGQLKDADISIIEAFVDSGSVQAMPLADRRILSATDTAASPDQQLQRLSQRMRAVGRSSDKPGGNNNKLIRLRTDSTSEGLKTALKLARSKMNLRSANRIPDDHFQPVRAHHIWDAVQELRHQTDWLPYSPSKDYDVFLEDGTRLPPKAVFGRAASLALGYSVLPIHFSGGVGTPSFKAIEAAGFAIVTKSGVVPVVDVRLPRKRLGRRVRLSSGNTCAGRGREAWPKPKRAHSWPPMTAGYSVRNAYLNP